MTDLVTVALAGSTGSIGTQTLDVVASEPERYRVTALGAGGGHLDLLVEQAKATGAEVVAVADEGRASELAAALPAVEVRAGTEGLASLGAEADVCVNGVVGFAGLHVTLATLAAGRRLALANKESLIAGGPVVQQVRSTPGAELVPVDSEHCAVHMCLRSADPDGPDRVGRVVLTASGGPFRGRSRDELADVTVDDALAHPTWSMGPKITVDSSTLMNKGLEVIEAHELFGVPYDRIEVVVHPQSIVHSMVEFTDGATIAQLSQPDMRLPIAYALAFPDRSTVPVGAIDWTSLSRLDFEPPDLEAFPCLGLAYEAGRAGGGAPAWLNAANEVAVAAFLEGRIRWIDIPDVLQQVLSRHDGGVPQSADDVVEVDRAGREAARTEISGRT
ncbi:1-deoxy-D-xylulose-5-phosphate reductoisomerase [Iamia majanohamensis]|uniref:1-deoxy-D-xylulose 5-phosphate reductoisomerase n=1 Tax=Iamia majanohamensis TaxID=467976 RepID=A0AAF0BSL0_9ACTN|nr:1-deoxy-D-xylulose-5-phosphate reductoisomerase [Iamia majanohamensis]WCO65422.1 1-deoxy-D-xylulose-5-phosphate reductoisomerase [Iamia majanohamensis]